MKYMETAFLAAALVVVFFAGGLLGGHAAAAGLSPGQCLQSNPTDCQNDPSHGGNPNAQGAQGSGGASQGAACDSFNKLSSGISCDESNNGNAGQSAISKVASNVVNALSIIMGFIAVILIVVAGFRYATSGGDPNAVGAAKSALIAAVIGIAIAALAQFLVHFVLNHSSG